MTAYQVLALLVSFYIVLGVGRLARDAYEYGGAAIIAAVIYPFCTDAAIGWWLVFVSVAVVATVIFAVRKRLAPIVAGAWHWLSAPHPPDKARRSDKWV